MKMRNTSIKPTNYDKQKFILNLVTKHELLIWDGWSIKQ